MNEVFAVGPEDIGKLVVVHSINKVGRIIWFTMDRVCVLLFSDKKAHEFSYDDCMYIKHLIRH